jgi:hypothetical protein
MLGAGSAWHWPAAEARRPNNIPATIRVWRKSSEAAAPSVLDIRPGSPLPRVLRIDLETNVATRSRATPFMMTRKDLVGHGHGAADRMTSP